MDYFIRAALTLELNDYNSNSILNYKIIRIAGNNDSMKYLILQLFLKYKLGSVYSGYILKLVFNLLMKSHLDHNL